MAPTSKAWTCEQSVCPARSASTVSIAAPTARTARCATATWAAARALQAGAARCAARAVLRVRNRCLLVANNCSLVFRKSYVSNWGAPVCVGSFGAGCASECACRNGGVCDPVSGACQCPPITSGQHCEFGCPPGSWTRAAAAPPSPFSTHSPLLVSCLCIVHCACACRQVGPALRALVRVRLLRPRARNLRATAIWILWAHYAYNS